MRSYTHELNKIKLNTYPLLAGKSMTKARQRELKLERTRNVKKRPAEGRIPAEAKKARKMQRGKDDDAVTLALQQGDEIISQKYNAAKAKFALDCRGMRWSAAWHPTS